MLLATGTILGCLIMAPLANRLGRRGALAFFFAIMAVSIPLAFGYAFYPGHGGLTCIHSVPVLCRCGWRQFLCAALMVAGAIPQRMPGERPRLCNMRGPICGRRRDTCRGSGNRALREHRRPRRVELPLAFVVRAAGTSVWYRNQGINRYQYESGENIMDRDEIKESTMNVLQERRKLSEDPCPRFGHHGDFRPGTCIRQKASRSKTENRPHLHYVGHISAQAGAGRRHAGDGPQGHFGRRLLVIRNVPRSPR